MNSCIFKLVPMACAVSLLAACGGNDSAPAPAAEVPWASPAMIVPPGADSKTIAISDNSGCMSNVELFTATLVVNASGDMILSGATNTAGPVTELHRINYATATYQKVEGQNTPKGIGARIELKNGNESMSARAGTFGQTFSSNRSAPPAHNINCNLTGTTSFAITTLPSSQRVASQMTGGITGIDTTRIENGTYTGGLATWENFNYGFDTPDRFIRFNVNTGAIGTSPNSTDTFVTTVINLPTTPTSTYAFFQEEIDAGTKRFELEVQRPSGGLLRVFFERIGDLLRPELGFDN